jgi:hypothetical protein
VYNFSNATFDGSGLTFVYPHRHNSYFITAGILVKLPVLFVGETDWIVGNGFVGGWANPTADFHNR